MFPVKRPSCQGMRRDACIHSLAPVITNTFSSSLTCRIIRVISNSLTSISTLIRASDRVRQKMGNSAAFSREIMRQERSIMRQIMRFFKS